ncbi:MAG TPA: Rv2993c-like domain-containing protein [Candidatus Binatus sp.]|uniref:fumarylacetoacetate hydrolase family protein n=1 Tax=Candidatus Binatus sp. TaxID=2811406 RepID=UPI002B46440B|nr:Rv2993c-like domain-containing protein [Candidatus Binatus sp.]HKN13946.1 Rv2993c-like domain-containing protein [Candidatus Binatus sp.]
MKIVRYRHDGGEQFGALEGDKIEPMEGELDALVRTAGAKSIPLDAVRLLAPLTPSKIVAAGLNYGEFVREQKVEPPKEPLIFLKPSTAVIGPNDAIVYPPQTHELYFEGELAIGPEPSPTGRVAASRLSRKNNGRGKSRTLPPPKPVPNRDAVPHLFLSLGAGVTPAEGSVKPTGGFTFNTCLLAASLLAALAGVR